MSTKKKTSSSRQGKKTSKTADALSICPTDGAGWCPYPFSAAQLKKRMERMKKEQEEKSLAGTTV